MADKTVTVGPDKTYASLQAAITGEVSANPDLTSMDGILTFELYAFEDTTLANLTGFTVDATRYIVIRTHSSARHAGVWDDTKYRLTGNTTTESQNLLTINVPYTQIYGLQLSQAGGFGVQRTLYINTGAHNTKIHSNIIRFNGYTGYATSTGISVDAITGANTYLHIYNNIIYGFYHATYAPVAQAINVSSIGNARPYVYNNTIADCGKGIEAAAYRWQSFKNNLFTGMVDSVIAGAEVGSYLTSSGYNATDDSAWNAGGSDVYTSQTGDRLSQTFTFENASGKNYKLTSADTGGWGYGASLVSDPNLPFSDDITGATRTTWNIGAFGQTAGGETVTGVVFGTWAPTVSALLFAFPVGWQAGPVTGTLGVYSTTRGSASAADAYVTGVSVSFPSRLLAFIGNNNGAVTPTISDTAGLSWSQVVTHAFGGRMTAFTAVVTGSLSNVSFTGTATGNTVDQYLTVVVITGSAGTGSTSFRDGSNSPASASLTPSAAGSLIMAAGFDWGASATRTMKANVTQLDEWLAPIGTWWTERYSILSQDSTTQLELGTSAPSAVNWGMIALEIK